VAGLSRVKFLVIDDNAYMTNIVGTILRGFGAKQIVEVRDATEAFERLKTDSFDIVIVDYMMPILDGIDFVKLIRGSSDSANRYVPIIMLTAHSERSRVELARDSGVTEFCCKPVTAQELFRKVVAVIDFPRPFIKTAMYFGPDRRRKMDTTYDGPERRQGWTPDHQPPSDYKGPTGSSDD